MGVRYMFNEIIGTHAASCDRVVQFLGARAPLGIARVKKKKKEGRKKFQKAINCSLLLLLAP